MRECVLEGRLLMLSVDGAVAVPPSTSDTEEAGCVRLPLLLPLAPSSTLDVPVEELVASIEVSGRLTASCEEEEEPP